MIVKIEPNEKGEIIKDSEVVGKMTYEKYQKPDVYDGYRLFKWETGLDLSDIFTEYGLEKFRGEGLVDNNNKLVLDEKDQDENNNIIL